MLSCSCSFEKVELESPSLDDTQSSIGLVVSVVVPLVQEASGVMVCSCVGGAVMVDKTDGD